MQFKTNLRESERKRQPDMMGWLVTETGAKRDEALCMKLSTVAALCLSPPLRPAGLLTGLHAR